MRCGPSSLAPDQRSDDGEHDKDDEQAAAALETRAEEAR